jgi:hypothetical protein
MTQLAWLNYDNTKIADAGLPKLKPLANPEFLRLGRTPVTEPGIEKLLGLRAYPEASL